MAGGCAWSRRVAARTRTLRSLVRDTQRALHDVCDIIHIDPEISVRVQEIGNQSVRSTALVILGSSPAARARLLHCLLGRQLLPDPPPRGCRWLRIQYGISTQVHLSLGNSEFELVEELECNKRPWETLPAEDLIRQDKTDLTTILEVEINNQFLKDGLRIIVPPDIAVDPGQSKHLTLKKLHSELYTKRGSILKNFNPVYLYAIDRTAKNIFSENISGSIVTSRSEEDFWNTFNLYYMASGGNGSVDGNDVSKESAGNRAMWNEECREPAVFTGENCLDLHQVKDINPNAQLLFILFSDSVDMNPAQTPGRPGRLDEATESTECDDTVFSSELPESDQGLFQEEVFRHSKESPKPNNDRRRLLEEQTSFMNELLDQWELMSSPSPKHHVKSQYLILDETEILRTSDQKPLAPYLSGPMQKASQTCGVNGGKRDGDRCVSSRTSLLNTVVKFAADCLQSYLLEFCTKLSEVHIKLLQQFILASFDMARELQVVPKKIQYVARQEQQLYETINEKFSEGDKKQELVQMMQEVLQEMRAEVDAMDWSVDDLPCHQDPRFTVSNSIFYSYRGCRDAVTFRPPPRSRTADGQGWTPDGPPRTAAGQSWTVDGQSRTAAGQSRTADGHNRTQTGDEQASDGEEAVSYDNYNFEDYEIIRSNADSYMDSFDREKPQIDEESSQFNEIRVENESEMFSLSSSAVRSGWTLGTVGSIGSVASIGSDATGTTCTNSVNISIKQASLDVQQTVLAKLSRKISLKLVKFVDCLKDSYFGTLQRCLESLEWSCRQELGGRPASSAMRELLSVARQVDLAACASFPLLRGLLDSLRRLLHRWRLAGGGAPAACCALSPAWRRRAAALAVRDLGPQRLARLISAQILERLSSAHERYQAALAALEAALAGRLHHTEDTKLAIRKKYAPSFARLCLESTSMCDLLMYGTPELGREIGRGQYGVVYSVRGGWGGLSPAAVKSVLPADERHYHELAMEFFYTRSIPSHPRIVRLHGSVVQRHGAGAGGGGAGGAGPCVLLVSERKVRDLHAAVRAGLTFAARMRIACDIVEGIRYLHSLGLVHRDIKMKNVLLDAESRAALSDLGFCAAEALMSGSVVGTPVHMAPELLQGDYDAAVDVYAFGILFWYVCAGNIKLPSAFELFQNKEQLWCKVKRGLRPERLPHFTEECWQVMESCWHSEPSQRALLGDVQPTLERILQQALAEDQGRHVVFGTHEPYEDSDDDSLDMTEIGNGM